MKCLKMLLLISIFTLSNELKTQSFFQDKTNIFYYKGEYSLSQGIDFVTAFYRDSIHTDSIVGNNEYYTVYHRQKSSQDSSSWRLRVNNKKVFYTGNIDNVGQVSDQLIYDFTRTAGDSFTLDLDKKYTFVVDSIKNIQYLDGIYRKAHYYTIKNGYHFIAVEGIGSLKRMAYFNNFNFPSSTFFETNYNNVIAVCHSPDSLVYFNGHLFKKDTIYAPTCDEQTIAMDLYHSGTQVKDIKKEHFKVFPNPVENDLTIQFETQQTGELKMYNNLGQIIYRSSFKTAGNIELQLPYLLTGMVYLQIQTEKFNATKLLVKVQ